MLDRIDSGNVDLYTVNGNVTYDGPIRDKGLYRLTTHNGTIGVALADKVNATLTVRTYNGSFRSSLSTEARRSGIRASASNVALGNGSASRAGVVRGGSILLRRPGEPRPEVDREVERKRARERVRDKDKDKEKGHDQAFADMSDEISREIDRAMRDVQPEIDRAMIEVQPEIERAMMAVQPEIDRAMSEALKAMSDVLPHVMPQPHPNPAPSAQIHASSADVVRPFQRVPRREAEIPRATTRRADRQSSARSPDRPAPGRSRRAARARTAARGIADAGRGGRARSGRPLPSGSDRDRASAAR